MVNDRRLIEDYLPLDVLNAIASQKKLHPRRYVELVHYFCIMCAVVSMKETVFLGTRQWIVGRIQIQPRFAWCSAMGLNKLLHQQFIKRVRVRDDAFVAVITPPQRMKFKRFADALCLQGCFLADWISSLIVQPLCLVKQSFCIPSARFPGREPGVLR